MQKIRRKQIYQYDLQKEYIFRNLINDEIIIGKLIDVDFSNDITDPEKFVIINLKTNQKVILNSLEHSRIQFNMNDQYFFQKKEPLTLKNIELQDKNKEGFYIFIDKNEKQIRKSIQKVKLPNSVSIIKNLKDLEIFLKTKGSLKIIKCTNVISSQELPNFQLEISDFQNQDTKRYFLSDLIIKPKNIYLAISKSHTFRESEINLLNWLLKEQIQIYLYLKKPVNNLEIGIIQKVHTGIQNNENDLSKDIIKDTTQVLFNNIFGNEIQIPYKEIEMINFEYNSAMIQLKSETSLSSRLGFRILKKFKPERIVMA